ncbi:MAG: tetratricopeptide repeat protein [Phycisphaerales bacterium]|nr:tetratricopeptide repeat protein [Phycisphaerales bacterium]
MKRAHILSNSLSFAAALTLSVGAITACKGPSAAGLEARKAAKTRFDRVGVGVATDQAEQALEAGQFSAALKHIDKVVAVTPDDFNARLLRGRIVLEMGRLESAATDFKMACELNPGCDEGRYYLGVVYQRWGRDDEALANYSVALAIEPSNTHYLLSEAETLLVLGRVSEAKQLVDDSLCHFEFNSALAHLRSEIAAAEGDDVEALHFIELAVTLAPDPMLYQEDAAVVAFNAEQWDRCLTALATLPPETSQREDLLRMRARCLVLTNRGHEARDMLVRLENAPASSKAGYTLEHDLTLGYIAWLIGDAPRAEACADRLMARNPTLCDGYLLKGVILERRGDLEAAATVLAKACQVDPNRKLARDLLLRTQAAHLAIAGVAVAAVGP